MFSPHRELKYSLAINEALRQVMSADERAFVIGQGVSSPWYVGETTKDLLNQFGCGRVIDTPISENAITGAAVGAAIAGMRPIVVHPRIDFMLFAFDAVINEAANWRYMAGGNSSAPVVIWGIINRGGEQGAQHSQSLHAMFAHVPGLKVVMPATPYDAKGLMVAAIQDDDPVVFIDDRLLYANTGPVPTELYSVPIGKAITRVEGTDVTIIASSYAAHLAHNAALELQQRGISAEMIDLRTIKPLDIDLLESSVRRTGRAIIVDGGWANCGLAGDIACRLYERCYTDLRTPIQRITLPDTPAPSARTLEKAYYINEEKIIAAVEQMVLQKVAP